MKPIKYILFGGTIVSTALFAGAGTADAYRGDPAIHGPNFSQERHASMSTAFRNGDYEAWKKLMGDRGRTRVTEVINRDNFPRFAEAQRLALDGNYDEARKIREELGLGSRNGLGFGERSGHSPRTRR